MSRIKLTIVPPRNWRNGSMMKNGLRTYNRRSVDELGDDDGVASKCCHKE